MPLLSYQMFARPSAFFLRFLAPAALCFWLAPATANAELPEQKPAEELIARQPQPKVMQRVLQKATPENTHLYISLNKQTAWFFVDKEVAIETPVSSGRKAAMTPPGAYAVMEKIEVHQSTQYGEFVDSKGRVIRTGVSAKLDSAPSGTTFQPLPKKHFLRLTTEGMGLHAGILPGYPAAQRSIRMPEAIARLIFENSKEGTPVIIGE